MDRGGWWASCIKSSKSQSPVHGVAKSQTRLKRCSMHARWQCTDHQPWMILEILLVGLWPSVRGEAVSPEDTRGQGELWHSDGQRLAGSHTHGVSPCSWLLPLSPTLKQLRKKSTCGARAHLEASADESGGQGMVTPPHSCPAAAEAGGLGMVAPPHSCPATAEAGGQGMVAPPRSCPSADEVEGQGMVAPPRSCPAADEAGVGSCGCPTLLPR